MTCYTAEEWKQLPIQEGVEHGPFPPLTDEDIADIVKHPDYYGPTDVHTLFQARHQYSEQMKAIDTSDREVVASQHARALEAALNIHWIPTIKRQELKSRKTAEAELLKITRLIDSPPHVYVCHGMRYERYGKKNQVFTGTI